MAQFDPGTFFEKQLALWPACRERYEALATAKRRTITLTNRPYTLIFNPLRATSASAKTDSGELTRPCFLCNSARPKEQISFAVTPDGSSGSYEIAVNPYPILSHHFTIISDRHCDQKISLARLRDMEFLARQMDGYLLFFNGAKAGASAPDHFHFQAVRQADVPLCSLPAKAKETLFIQTCGAENVKIDFAGTDMLNILCWREKGLTRWIVVRRRCHRPAQYYADGAQRLLISPASLEFAGIVPLAREEDFRKMNAGLLTNILRQCYNNEPLIDVGLTREDVSVKRNDGGTTTVSGMRIGIGFHWEQRKTLTFEGEMLVRKDKDSAWLINRIAAEDYLRSVIASEMAGTSNLPLLKAHAVISRSWLVRQLARKNFSIGEEKNCSESNAAGEIIRWYDAGSHTLFDVCADDHCQRYQGICKQPLVEKAIDETRGEVLMFDGGAADARFSKCCGGKTEEYRYCWENIAVPYLASTADTRADGTVFCDTRDEAILGQVLNDYDRATTDFFAWEKVFTQAELSEIIESKQHLGLGKITSLEAVERGASGRISRLKITGENGAVVIGKELEIRRTLSRDCLYSSNFEVAKTASASGEITFKIKGRGWGHGAGLCQIGAAVMGSEGYGYKEILAHYYRGTTIEKIW